MLFVSEKNTLRKSMSLGRSPASLSDWDRTKSELRCCLASVESVTISTTFDFTGIKIIYTLFRDSRGTLVLQSTTTDYDPVPKRLVTKTHHQSPICEQSQNYQEQRQQNWWLPSYGFHTSGHPYKWWTLMDQRVMYLDINWLDILTVIVILYRT